MYRGAIPSARIGRVQHGDAFYPSTRRSARDQFCAWNPFYNVQSAVTSVDQLMTTINSAGRLGANEGPTSDMIYIGIRVGCPTVVE